MTKANNATKSTYEFLTDDCRGRSTVTRRLAMNMIVSAAALTAGSKAIASAQPDDSVLLEMEEKIFEHRAAAQAYDDEILEARRYLEARISPASSRIACRPQRPDTRRAMGTHRGYAGMQRAKAAGGFAGGPLDRI